MTDTTVDWETIRTLAAEAGIGPEFQAYEDTLPNLITGTILEGTGTKEKYLSDEVFRTNVDLLVHLIVSMLTRVTRLATKPADMEALSKIFLEEFNESRR